MSTWVTACHATQSGPRLRTPIANARGMIADLEKLRAEAVREMHDKGDSYGKIAEHLGISKIVEGRR